MEQFLRKSQNSGEITWTRVKRSNGNYGYVRTKNGRPVDFDEYTGRFKMYDLPDTNSNWSEASKAGTSLGKIKSIERRPDSHADYVAQQKLVDAQDEAHDLTPIFANLMTAGQAPVVNEGAENIKKGNYLLGASLIASPLMFGSGAVGTAARSGVGLYNLTNENGVRKTINNFSEGNYGQGALSLLGDTFNAAMAAEGLGSISNALKGTSGYKNWRLAREINLATKSKPKYISVPSKNLFRTLVYKGGEITDPYSNFVTTDSLYAANYGKVTPYIFESKSVAKAKEPMMGYRDPANMDMFLYNNTKGNPSATAIIGHDAVTGEFTPSKGIEILNMNPKNLYPVRTSEPLTSLKFFERKPSRISKAERLGIPKGERNNKKIINPDNVYGNLRFIRNIDGLPTVKDGLVQLGNSDKLLTNFTTDLPFRLHDWYPNIPGPTYMIVSPRAFKGKKFYSIKPSDSFLSTVDSKVTPNQIRIISGDPKILKEAERRGMRTLTSDKLQDLFNVGSEITKKEFELGRNGAVRPFANADVAIDNFKFRNRFYKENIPEILSKYPEGVVTPYRTEVDKLITQNIGRPSIKDYLVLENMTGLDAGITSKFDSELIKKAKDPLANKDMFEKVYYPVTSKIEEELMNSIGLYPGPHYSFFNLLKLNKLKGNPLKKKQGGKMNTLWFLKNGSGIHIKKKNRGKFTSYCGGKVTDSCIRRAKASGNPTLVKRATFADNARKWKHKEGGKAFIDNVNVLDSNPRMYKYLTKIKVSPRGVVKKLTGGSFVNNALNFINSDTGQSIIGEVSNIIQGMSAKKKLNKAIKAIDALKKAIDELYNVAKNNIDMGAIKSLAQANLELKMALSPGIHFGEIDLGYEENKLKLEAAAKATNDANALRDQALANLNNQASLMSNEASNNIIGNIGGLLNGAFQLAGNYFSNKTSSNLNPPTMKPKSSYTYSKIASNNFSVPKTNFSVNMKL